MANDLLPDNKHDDDLLNDLEKSLRETPSQDEVDSGLNELENFANQGRVKDDENFTGVPNNTATNPSSNQSSSSTGIPSFGSSTHSSDAQNIASSSPTATELEAGNSQTTSVKDKDIQTEGGFDKQEDEFANKAQKIKGKGLFNKKRTGIVTALLVSGALGFGSILQGPAQFLHFASLLEQFHLPFVEDQDVSSITRAYRFMRDPNNPENRRLSTLSKKIVEDIEARGQALGGQLEYDRNSNNRLSGIVIDPDSSMFNTFRAEYGDSLQQTSDGKYRIDASNNSQARRLVNTYTKGISQSADKVGAVKRRMIKAKAGISFRWLGDLRNRIDDTFSIERLREFFGSDREQKITNGNTADVDLQVRDPETGQPRPADIDPDTPDIETGRVNIAIGGGLSVVGGVCLANAVASNVDGLHFDGVWLPSMRIAAKMVSLGSQVKSMDEIDLDELGLEAELLNSEAYTIEGVEYVDAEGNTHDSITKDKLNWSASSKLSEKYNKEGGVKPSPDTVPRLDSTDNPVVNFIQSIPLLGELCDVAGNPVIGGALDKITGGGWLSVVLENTIGDAVLSRLVDVATRAWVGTPVPWNIAGPDLFSVADFGMLLNTNEEVRSSGGLKVPPKSEQQINARLYENQLDEQLKTPFLTRVFSYKNPNSLVAQVFMGVNYSGSIFDHGKQAIAALYPSNIISPITQPTYAQSLTTKTTEELYDGLNREGWTDEEINHSLDENVNNSPSNYVDFIFPDTEDFGYYQQFSSLFTEHCYGVKINSDGSVTAVENSTIHPNGEVEYGDSRLLIGVRKFKVRENYCMGTEDLVGYAIGQEINAQENVIKNVCDDLGGNGAPGGCKYDSLGDIDYDRTCQSPPNNTIRTACRKLSVLPGIRAAMRHGEGQECNGGVFYRDYEDPWYNAREDKFDDDNFPFDDGCYWFPGEKLHQNARIYIKDMTTLQGMACWGGVDDQACVDSGMGSSVDSTDPSGATAMLPEGNAQELARQILDIVDSGGPISIGATSCNATCTRNSIEQIAENGTGPITAGSGAGTSVPVNPRLLQVILAIAEENIPIRITALTTGGHGANSQHFKGEAVDIGNEEVAGQLMPFIFENREVLGIYELFHDPSPHNQYNINNGAPSPGPIGNHSGHIHIGVNP